MPKTSPPAPRRTSGVLLHVTSLPGPYGVGDLGTAAHAWVDELARAGQTWWQILPLGPPGHGDSPYQAYSAFAGNPSLVSPDLLVSDGLLRREDVKAPGGASRGGRVDYASVNPFKAALLSVAWEHFRQGGAARALQQPFEKFRAAQASWLEDYALFMALREAHGHVAWTDWPKELVQRKPAAMREARRELEDVVDRARSPR